ncbi:MAG TPA: hypothetical protein VJX66_05665 [Amycolatopsis sp.]|nr:hypothetical protein [Amycolatopsis sp.]
MTPEQSLKLDYLYAVFQRYPVGVPGGEVRDGSWTGDTGEFVRKLERDVAAVSVKLDGLTAAVAALSKDPGLTEEKVRQIVTEAVERAAAPAFR